MKKFMLICQIPSCRISGKILQSQWNDVKGVISKDDSSIKKYRFNIYTIIWDFIYFIESQGWKEKEKIKNFQSDDVHEEGNIFHVVWNHVGENTTPFNVQQEKYNRIQCSWSDAPKIRITLDNLLVNLISPYLVIHLANTNKRVLSYSRIYHKTTLNARLDLLHNSIENLCLREKIDSNRLFDHEVDISNLSAPENYLPILRLLRRKNKFQKLLMLIVVLFQLAKKYHRKKRYWNQWKIALINPKNLSHQINIIHPPDEKLWADPFILPSKNHQEKNTYVLLEELTFYDKKGHITCLVLDENGNLVDRKVILEKPYHLSYPFVFESNGNLYMIPESSQNHDIQMYKCVSYPFEWKYETTIMENVVAVDSNLFFYNEKWWLFANMKQIEGANLERNLYLFSADNPLSNQWIPHPLNPIVSDIRYARMGGGIIEENGKLYRVAQGNLKRYGHYVAKMEIIQLSENAYQEKIHQIIHAKVERSIGTHHFYQQNKHAVMDLCIPRKKPVKA